jgi:hypothetical protein
MLPVYLTDHSRARLYKRVGCRDDSNSKMEKMAKKAWASKEECKRLNRKAYYHEKIGDKALFRFFCGYYFVFMLERGVAKLITVIDPRKKYGADVY